MTYLYNMKITKHLLLAVGFTLAAPAFAEETTPPATTGEKTPGNETSAERNKGQQGEKMRERKREHREKRREERAEKRRERDEKRAEKRRARKGND